MAPVHFALNPSFVASVRGRRARFAEALDSLGLLDRLLWLRARLRLPLLSVLTYHRVAYDAEVAELDPGVAEVSPRELEEQLALLKDRCTVVSLAEVRQFLRGRSLPANPVMLAFDDGYRDNHDVVLPLLKKAGVPATFFIPTAFPDAGKLFWWDRAALLLRRCCRARVELSYPAHLTLEPTRDPIAASNLVLRALKRTPGVDLERVWEELERVTGVSLGADEERRLAEATIMSWRQIRALRQAGMEVQSHSHSHRVLQTLPLDEVTRDLCRSRRVLGEALGEGVDTIAYPVGYRLERPLLRAVADAGFSLGFTNNSGMCLLTHVDPLNFPRVSMARGQIGAPYKLRLLVGEPIE